MPFLEKSSNSISVRGLTGSVLDNIDTEPWNGDGGVSRFVSKSVLQQPFRHDGRHQTCGNPECSGGWKMPWKSRRRPIFESRWGCSISCLESIIHKALHRERGDSRLKPREDLPHRHRVPLGLVMLSQGFITQQELREALMTQRLAGHGRIGDWLVQKYNIDPEQVTRGLAVQWSCPVLPADGFSPVAMALIVPRLLMKESSMLPLRVAASRILYLAFNDRLDATTAFAIEQMSGLKVASGLLDDRQFVSMRDRLLEEHFVAAQQVFFSDTDSLAAKIAMALHQSQAIDSRLVRIHQHYWLRSWLETGAYSGVGTLPETGEDVIDTIFSFDRSSSNAKLANHR